METPKVSVILPVYNSEKYLQKAIDSILHQTLPDFELIIINDCSTDSSEQIIKTYTDKRIRYIKQPENLGVVAAMNTGLQIASSPLVAVMHSDDIAFESRLQRQLEHFENNPDVAVVAGFVVNINEQGDLIGRWMQDRSCITATQIRNNMVKSNCIAHPTVMMKTAIARRMQYHLNQQSQEDYDLWLRMLAEGLVIEKVPEEVLYYREHSASITGTILRKANPFFKLAQCKKKFLAYQIKSRKWGLFETKVLAAMLYDTLMGIGKNINKTIAG